MLDRGLSPEMVVTEPELHPPMNIASLFNLAGPDVIIILGIVALLFGAKKLPELAKGMGQAAREFVKAKDAPLIEDKKEQPSQPS
jgi:sec-independent protein translocase protein TatA